MAKTSYSEPFLDYGQLALLLQSKGMTGSLAVIEQRLKEVGYKRLSAFWIPFYDETTGRINCDIEVVWTHYCFDRRLRLMLMDAIERIEVCVRNRLIHYFTQAYGPYGHLERDAFASASRTDWLNMNLKMSKQGERAQKNRQSLFSRFFDKYDNECLPLWLQCELMDFGTAVIFLKSVKRNIQKQVSDDFNLPSPPMLISWLEAFNDIRNACAHHNRVWNRVWAKNAQLPKKSGLWYQAGPQNSLPVPLYAVNKTGVFLAICQYMLQILGSTSNWKQRLFDLFDEPRFLKIPVLWMGLPPDWRSLPPWI